MICKHYHAYCLLVSLSVAIAHISLIASPRHRDLSGYDRFGPVTIRNSDVRRMVETYNELRGFIWTHWHQQRRGYAVITEYSIVDLGRCDTTIAVQPGANGDWEIEMLCKCKRGRPKIDSSIITSIQRLATDANGYRTDVPIPDTANVPPGSYVLMVRDAAGRVVRAL